MRDGNLESEQVNHGLDDDVLNQIPVYYFRKATLDTSASVTDSTVPGIEGIPELKEEGISPQDQDSRNILNLSSEEGKCIICLGDYAADEPLKVLPCHHHFHKVCIDEWLHIQKTCPLCVQEVQYQIDQEIP